MDKGMRQEPPISAHSDKSDAKMQLGSIGLRIIGIFSNFS